MHKVTGFISWPAAAAICTSAQTAPPTAEELFFRSLLGSSGCRCRCRYRILYGYLSGAFHPLESTARTQTYVCSPGGEGGAGACCWSLETRNQLQPQLGRLHYLVLSTHNLDTDTPPLWRSLPIRLRRTPRPSCKAPDGLAGNSRSGGDPTPRSSWKTKPQRREVIKSCKWHTTSVHANSVALSLPDTLILNLVSFIPILLLPLSAFSPLVYQLQSPSLSLFLTSLGLSSFPLSIGLKLRLRSRERLRDPSLLSLLLRRETSYYTIAADDVAGSAGVELVTALYGGTRYLTSDLSIEDP